MASPNCSPVVSPSPLEFAEVETFSGSGHSIEGFSGGIGASSGYDYFRNRGFSTESTDSNQQTHEGSTNRYVYIYLLVTCKYFCDILINSVSNFYDDLLRQLKT